jgi:outer membrane lipase/esterase
MNKRRGALLRQAIIVASLQAACIAGAQAGGYSNLYFFGDSITDSGVFFGQRFTTKPGTVWAENLGASYGMLVSPAFAVDASNLANVLFPLNASGNNFAVGDSQINSPPVGKPQATALPSVKMQVDGFLSRGTVDTKALYALWAGGNDIFAQYSALPGLALPDAQANLVTAASDMLTQVTRLQTAGARNVIVIGAMDMTKSPSGLALDAASLAQLGALMNTFDASMKTDLAGKNVLYFDMVRLNNQILGNPQAYGFTDTTTPACPGTPPNALTCNVPANGHMYADERHPSTLFHEVIADWIYGSLEGASRVGLMSQVPMGRSGAQWRAIDGRLREFQNFGYEGQGFFATGDGASSDIDAHGGQPSADGSGGSFVMGYEKAFGEQLFGGVTLGYGNAPFDLGNNLGSVKYDDWALSAFVSKKFGNFYANALTTYSWLDYQSKRNVALGSFTTTERGETHGGQFGVKGQIGYNFVSGNLLHGPLVGLAWEQVKVNGFSEQSNSVTAMSFGDQTRESLRSRLGWQVAADTTWSGTKVRPYAQLSYDYEHLKDERSYSAGFVGGTSAMQIQTSNQTGGYGTLLAGVTAELSKTMRLTVGGSTTISQPGARNSAINVTLSMPL